MTPAARHYAEYLRVNAGGRLETTMIRPEEVPVRVDAERQRKIKQVEDAIDMQLLQGLDDDRAVVKLPEGFESVLADVRARYRGVGWEVTQEGMGFLTFRRGATDPHRPR